jgi:4-carboxymuconolactone decarboxylase
MADERLPLPAQDAMTAAQRAAAEQLRAGPRKGVKGPFIPLLRSPELLVRLEKVGEYLRFDSAIPPRIAEFATLVVARAWSQQFEWAVHVPLALKAGTEQASIDDLRDGRRPASMSAAEALVFDFVSELSSNRGVSQAGFDAVVAEWGEQGLVDLVATVGYFTMISMVLNVAHTPRDAASAVEPLPVLPR